MKVGDLVRWKSYSGKFIPENQKQYHIGIVTGSEKVAGGEVFNIYAEGEIFKITEWLLNMLDKCEILFGLDENTNNNEKEQLSTMSQIIETTEANKIDSNIRNEIDQQFANEMNTESIYQIEWENETQVLDAIKESERIRNQLFEGKSISEGELPITTKKTKLKKKKRFFFF